MQLHRGNILNIVLTCKIDTTRNNGQTDLIRQTKTLESKNHGYKKKWLKSKLENIFKYFSYIDLVLGQLNTLNGIKKIRSKTET